MGINLTIFNQSNDVNNSDIVILQKNVATNLGELVVAWKVIQNLAIGNYHPLVYDETVTINAIDAWGNFTPRLAAVVGQQYSMYQASSGSKLERTGMSASPNELEIRNQLPMGSITANVYRSERLVAQKTLVAPQQKAVFSFQTIIWIGAIAQVEEGKAINSAILSDINTELSLIGIKSADIVMRGGGGGPQATAFTFSLENIVQT